MTRTIDTNQINHTWNRHGPGGESDPTQVPVSPEAVAAYIDVVETFDAVEGGIRASRTNRLTYTKQINGVIYVIEELRREGSLAFFDMWIKKSE